MIFPTYEQVRGKASKTPKPIHNYLLTTAEKIKINSMLKNERSISQIDSRHSFENMLRQFDSIFGRYVELIENKIVLRGKFDYKGKLIDPRTGEKQIVYTVSNPKALYRKLDSDLYFIRVPERENLISGFYAEAVINLKSQTIPNIPFVDFKGILPINFEFNMPTIFLDYAKFNDVFKIDYGFDMSETSQKYKRNLNLTNSDLLLINKIAGENFHDDVRGGVNCNIIKYSSDQNSYNLEVIDNFLDIVTYTNNSENIFNKNLVRCGNLRDFGTILSKDNRLLPTSRYKTFYGCNIGFSIGKTLHFEEDKFLEKLDKSSVDYLNPIGSIETRSKSVVDNILKANKEFIFSSQALFLMTQLLPIKSKIVDIETENPKVLRMTTMLKKFEDCVDDLGTDVILPKLNISQNDINAAAKFLENNRKDVEDFITNNGF